MERGSRYEKTIKFFREKTQLIPEILIVLGSGLGKIAEKIELDISIPYKDIPYFKHTNIPTHAGNLVFGRLAGKALMIMQGRLHVYEGHNLEDIVYPIRIAKRLGVKRAILTNLSGGINKDFNRGDFMVVADHINVSGKNPLIGSWKENTENPFVDMFNAYSARLIELMEKAATAKNIMLHKGVLAYLTGPNFETAAELRFLRLIGADAVGWSIVPEVLMARHLNMEVLGICCISDLSNPETLKSIDIQEIFNVGLDKADELNTLIETFISMLP